MSIFIAKWQSSLREVLRLYDEWRPGLKKFYPRLFLFFFFVNVFCYWWACLTAFPDSIYHATWYYFKVQVPVGFLGALFDSLSFFITIWIINQAARAKSKKVLISHLFIDVIIAILATFWVLFVFSFSSWLIRLSENDPSMSAKLIERQAVYKGRVEDAVKDPVGNIRNIYFGVIMGVSAILPTLFHVYIAFRSRLKSRSQRMLRFETWVKRIVYRFFS